MPNTLDPDSAVAVARVRIYSHLTGSPYPHWLPCVAE